MINSRPNFALIAPDGVGGSFIAGPGSHVIMFSVDRFTCKERVMLIEREIMLLKLNHISYAHAYKGFVPILI